MRCVEAPGRIPLVNPLIRGGTRSAHSLTSYPVQCPAEESNPVLQIRNLPC